MSEKNPGGHGYVPLSPVGQCERCGAHVTRLAGGIIRKHLDPDKPSHFSRAERICPGSRTDQWKEPS